MKLSVIIVNYNVKYFLEQCLLSVRKAVTELKKVNSSFETEVIVVDNNSVDSSLTMVSEKFPEVKLIVNTKNLGYSVANNQALKIAGGEYLLLLNPDTIVEEKTFASIVDFMDANSQAGSLGVKMVDGKGVFLPESKRGFPTPSTAFFKISGLSRLFPASRIFGKYHLGYLEDDKTHEVDVLSGAFMLLRKSVIEKTGLLDETFFMYGEDIDLSYRIKLAGFKNYYFPETTIIHYKGESTKKNSINYVFLFYQAMIIFAKKHFSKKYASVYSLLIHIAIYARASVSVVHRLIKTTAPIVLDCVGIFGFLLLVKLFWESNIQIGHGSKYPNELVSTLFPVFTGLWIAGLAILSNYRRPFNTPRILKGVLLGSLLISAFYAFLPENMRFSRALIVFGTFSTFVISVATRFIINFFESKTFSFNFTKITKIAVVGNQVESERIFQLLQKSNIKFEKTGTICPENISADSKTFIGNISQINELIDVFSIDELIFCSKDIPLSQMIEAMGKIKKRNLVFKTAPQESMFIIGSNSKNKTGDYYTIDIGLAISKPGNKFEKRLLDILLSLSFLLFFIFILPFQKSFKAFFSNIFLVLFNKKSWVGYIPKTAIANLPEIKEGILCPLDSIELKELNTEELNRLNIHYATEYSVLSDLYIIRKGFRNLGRKDLISPGKL